MICKKENSTTYLSDLSTKLFLQYYENGVRAGFPSPASNYEAKIIDLNMALLIDKDNTKFRKVTDYDLEGECIYYNDLAVLDTSLTAVSGNKVFCEVHGENLFRKITINHQQKKVILSATDLKIPDIEISDPLSAISKGVVTYTITPHIPTNIYANGKREGSIDINTLLVKNPAYTFLGLIEGDSMKEAKILNGDLSLIDKSLPYISGYKAMCRIEDTYTVKFLEWDKKDKNTLWLMPANMEFPPIRLTKNDKRVEVFGIITYTITPHTRKFENLL